MPVPSIKNPPKPRLRKKASGIAAGSSAFAAKNGTGESAKLLISRHRWVNGLFLLIAVILLWRIVYLQVMHKEFLQSQGDARLMRVTPVAAHRGMLLDRRGEALAVSTPVDSAWVHPKQLMTARNQWPLLMKRLGMRTASAEEFLEGRMQREFVYLKRHISPNSAAQIMALKIPGVFLQREYRRYYPAGGVTAHVVGFTNVDDIGQEGLELAFDETLKGISGSKRVIQDKWGKIIADVENLGIPRPGHDMRLSIDRRLEYLAYRELAAAVKRHKARSGSAIILDVHSGEVLAMVNLPSYNPNNRADRNSKRYRNRALTDVFEPGSTMKPFIAAAALESGRYTPGTFVNTAPGKLHVDDFTVRDVRNYGRITVSAVLQKSSNVGAAKIALSLKSEFLWKVLSDAGFGENTNSGFPGETRGRLEHYFAWTPVKRASQAFGYGLSVTLLQLARAYAVLADKGRLRPVRFIPSAKEKSDYVQVIKPETARQVRKILETVVSGGTGKLARVPGYRVAGKTGTVHKSVAGGYASDKYVALFVGMAPARTPRLVVAVMIDEPRGKKHFGGEAAAPVFSKITAGALRLLNIPPD
ncbi:MAG: penicillin-binding protein 2 [Gammaproteobacteria bacterium]|nr:penicillin-binding protein 2 [Gammaproteobacteria bacterium]